MMVGKGSVCTTSPSELRRTMRIRRGASEVFEGSVRVAGRVEGTRKPKQSQALDVNELAAAVQLDSLRPNGRIAQCRFRRRRAQYVQGSGQRGPAVGSRIRRSV